MSGKKKNGKKDPFVRQKIKIIIFLVILFKNKKNKIEMYLIYSMLLFFLFLKRMTRNIMILIFCLTKGSFFPFFFLPDISI
jgi:hypothetical protein